MSFNDGPHGFADGDYVVYLHGCNNGAIGGLTDTRPYWIRKVDDNTIYQEISVCLNFCHHRQLTV